MVGGGFFEGREPMEPTLLGREYVDGDRCRRQDQGYEGE